MSEAVFTAEELDDLYRARTVRLSIISDITQKQNFVDNPENVNLVLKAAADLDKAALGKAKVRVASKSATTSQAQVAALIATMNMSGLSPVAVDHEAKDKKNSFVIVDLKPGEDTMGRVAIGMDELEGLPAQAKSSD